MVGAASRSRSRPVRPLDRWGMCPGACCSHHGVQRSGRQRRSLSILNLGAQPPEFHRGIRQRLRRACVDHALQIRDLVGEIVERP